MISPATGETHSVVDARIMAELNPASHRGEERILLPRNESYFTVFMRTNDLSSDQVSVLDATRGARRHENSFCQKRTAELLWNWTENAALSSRIVDGPRDRASAPIIQQETHFKRSRQQRGKKLSHRARVFPRRK